MWCQSRSGAVNRTFDSAPNYVMDFLRRLETLLHLSWQEILKPIFFRIFSICFKKALRGLGSWRELRPELPSGWRKGAILLSKWFQTVFTSPVVPQLFFNLCKILI
jgi:hypothetical protein